MEGNQSLEVMGEEFTYPIGIDLGLSVKWSDRNLGASSPEDYGKYFAWGEIEPKVSYDLGNYHISDNISELEHLNIIDGLKNLHGTYDAAVTNWGKPWRMPTMKEVQELSNKCNWKFTEKNGLKGYEIYGVNNNSIFLPAIGYLSGTSLRMANSHLLYWSSTLCPMQTSYCAYILFAYLSQSNVTYYNRCFGLPIRPVIDVSSIREK